MKKGMYQSDTSPFFSFCEKIVFIRSVCTTYCLAHLKTNTSPFAAVKFSVTSFPIIVPLSSKTFVS